MILFGIPNYSIFLTKRVVCLCWRQFPCSFVPLSHALHFFRIISSFSRKKTWQHALRNTRACLHILPACLPYYVLFKAQNVFILLLAIFCTVWRSKWITLKRKICQKHLHLFIIIGSAHFQPKMPIKKHWANKLSFDLYFNAVFLLDCLLKISIDKKNGRDNLDYTLCNMFISGEFDVIAKMHWILCAMLPKR